MNITLERYVYFNLYKCGIELQLYRDLAFILWPTMATTLPTNLYIYNSVVDIAVF